MTCYSFYCLINTYYYYILALIDRKSFIMMFNKIIDVIRDFYD